MGRFLQPDTAVPDPMDPQARDRYTYVLNNPFRYTDPTGRTVYDPSHPEYTCLLGVQCPRPAPNLPLAPPLSSYPAPAPYVPVEPAPQPLPPPPIGTPPCPEWACPAPVPPMAICWGCAFTAAGRFVVDLPGTVDRELNQVAESIERICAERDCVTMAIGVSAVFVAVVGTMTLQPELVAAGVALYGAQYQYTWSQYQQGRATEADVFNAALVGAPGAVGNEQEANAWQALLNALDVAQETICPEGC